LAFSPCQSPICGSCHICPAAWLHVDPSTMSMTFFSFSHPLCAAPQTQPVQHGSCLLWVLLGATLCSKFSFLYLFFLPLWQVS
jgi:hypothetical protein